MSKKKKNKRNKGKQKQAPTKKQDEVAKADVDASVSEETEASSQESEAKSDDEAASQEDDDVSEETSLTEDEEETSADEASVEVHTTETAEETQQTSAAKDVLISLKGVSRSFRDGEGELHVLREVDWDIEAGTSVAIMGRSGSGKSTLLNLIGGLDRGYAGEIVVDGLKLESLNDAKLAAFRNEKIGFIFQSFHLMRELTCEENVLMPAWFSDQKLVGIDRAKELLERVGLGAKIGQRPGPFSGGEKQRIAIARALLMQPKILLCDEPTGNLDEETSEEILTLFQTLQREEGLTFLMVTHELQAAQIADQIFVLQQGQLALRQPEQE